MDDRGISEEVQVRLIPSSIEMSRETSATRRHWSRNPAPRAHRDFSYDPSPMAGDPPTPNQSIGQSLLNTLFHI